MLSRILLPLFSSQVRGKSQTGCQTWLPPSSIHWLQATTGRLPSPTGDRLSTASNAGLPTPAWSAGLQTAPCSCTVPSRDPCRLQTTGTVKSVTVCFSGLQWSYSIHIHLYTGTLAEMVFVAFAISLLQVVYCLFFRTLITLRWSWRKVQRDLVSVSAGAESTRWTYLCCALLRTVLPYVMGEWGWDDENHDNALFRRWLELLSVENSCCFIKININKNIR